MIAFGWRPQQSCYKTLNDGTPGCPTVTWFYLLMAAAVVGGLVAKKK